ncbi:MAG: Hsp20 family protein, partial [Alphaproteobacteria bacterium]
YRITMAVAGFSREDLDISVEGDVLTIAGKANSDADTRHYLHRGIAGRSFQRRFNLAEHVQVKSAALENGLLHVDLVHEVPEALKPRTIKIESGSGKSWRKAITGEAA